MFLKDLKLSYPELRLFNAIERQYADIFPPASAQTLSFQSDSGDYAYYRSYSSVYRSGLAVSQDSLYYALYGKWYYFSDFNYANQLFANNTCRQQSAATYQIVNQNSGKCVDSYSGGTSDWTKLIQYSCNNTSPNEYWQLKKLSDGSYNIVNKNSGKCLDV